MCPPGLQVLGGQVDNLCTQLVCSLGLGLHQLSLFLGLRAQSCRPQRQNDSQRKGINVSLYSSLCSAPRGIHQEPEAYQFPKPGGFPGVTSAPTQLGFLPRFVFFPCSCNPWEFICLRVPCTCLSLCHDYPPCRNLCMGSLKHHFFIWGLIPIAISSQKIQPFMEFSL